jgi:formylglycine-generating enzyme required for sulfatase activity
LKDMVRVAGGRFLMGSDDFYPEERPVHCILRSAPGGPGDQAGGGKG